MSFQPIITDTALPDGHPVLMRPDGGDVQVFVNRQALHLDPEATMLALLDCATVRLDAERRLRAAS